MKHATKNRLAITTRRGEVFGWFTVASSLTGSRCPVFLHAILALAHTAKDMYIFNVEKIIEQDKESFGKALGAIS